MCIREGLTQREWEFLKAKPDKTEAAAAIAMGLSIRNGPVSILCFSWDSLNVAPEASRLVQSGPPAVWSDAEEATDMGRSPTPFFSEWELGAYSGPQRFRPHGPPGATADLELRVGEA